MAQDQRSPWSRWDLPTSADARPSGSMGLLPPQFDHVPTGSIGSVAASEMPQKYVDATLITKELNANDANFYNCIYGVPNSLQQVIQECHVDVDCCERTCCDTNWRTKYAFAIILLSLFCVIVLVSLLIWLVIWLLNRSRDKKLRKEFADQVYPPQAVNATPYATIKPAGAGSNSTINRRF